MARKLIYEVVLDSAAYTRQIKKVTEQTTAFAGSTKKLDRDLSRAARGAAAGSGLFRGLGRSVAFASGGFLAFSSATEFLRSSVDAAREAAVAQRSLAAQMKAAGESFDANRERIDKVALSYGKFGFQNDEVIQSLTVLERGTGSINKAIALQGLTANIARAKNIGLANAATVVAKVFGRQETALRRAVPGLAKNAHGWDLIRLAQAKMAGQAAANTTATERFGATLHDTEEIIGTALLPTLNKTIEAIGKWLQHMNQTGELQRDVTQVTKTLAEVFTAAKDALHGLDVVTGSTKNTLKLLFSAFVAFKAVKLVSSLSEMAGSIGLIGRNAKTATGEVAGLRTEMGLLIAVPLAADLVKNELAATKKLTALNAKAQGGARLFPGTKTFEGHAAGSKPFIANQGGILAGQLVAVRSIDGQLWVVPVSALKAMTQAADGVKPHSGTGFREANLSPTAATAAAVPPGVTAAQRNAWFDAMVGRRELRAGLLTGAKAQLAAYRAIGVILTARIAATKDITRKLNLEDEALRNAATVAGIQAQIAADLKQKQQDAAQKLKDQIEAARQEKLGWLDFAIERAGVTKTIKDDLAAYRAKEKFLQGLIRTEGRTLDLVSELWRVRQQIKDLNKKNVADGDPLAGLFQVSSKGLANILAAGTGLGAAGRRRLGFNIAGAEIQPVHVHLNLDGREVASVVTKQQARAGNRTAKQTSGRRG